MNPELYTIPYLNVSIKAYGSMMVIGFLCALFLARSLCRHLKENPNHLMDFGIYALLAGVIGARIFHVIHYWDDYDGRRMEIFMFWKGGLEFLGGVIGGLPVMIMYLRKRKLSLMKYLDILAPALMLGLTFGRIGCFLNGCCFGAPTDLPWAIEFPTVNNFCDRSTGCQKSLTPQYSIPFDYQLYPDVQRRPDGKPLLELPPDFYYGYMNKHGQWALHLSDVPEEHRNEFFKAPIRPEDLQPEQLHKLEDGTIHMHKIHPAQIYSSLSALLICGILTLSIRRFYKFHGQVFATMLILYGIARFILEGLRNSSPLEFNGLTISQNLSILGFITGWAILAIQGFRANQRVNLDGPQEE